MCSEEMTGGWSVRRVDDWQNCRQNLEVRSTNNYLRIFLSQNAAIVNRALGLALNRSVAMRLSSDSLTSFTRMCNFRVLPHIGKPVAQVHWNVQLSSWLLCHINVF
jgi:hypothetical protein